MSLLPPIKDPVEDEEQAKAHAIVMQRINAASAALPAARIADQPLVSFTPEFYKNPEPKKTKKEIEDILHTKVNAFKKDLNARELDIFDRRIFSDSPETLQQIGEIYSISRERVRQIENNILKKMKAYFKKDMPDFDMYDHNQ